MRTQTLKKRLRKLILQSQNERNLIKMAELQYILTNFQEIVKRTRITSIQKLTLRIRIHSSIRVQVKLGGKPRTMIELMKFKAKLATRYSLDLP